MLEDYFRDFENAELLIETVREPTPNDSSGRARAVAPSPNVPPDCVKRVLRP